jgi:hypothetical protein
MNPSHESVWNNIATMHTYGTTTVSDHNKFLEVKAKNNTDKTIRGIKFVTAYYDSTEDLTTIPHTWGLHGEVKPGTIGTGNLPRCKREKPKLRPSLDITDDHQGNQKSSLPPMRGRSLAYLAMSP